MKYAKDLFFALTMLIVYTLLAFVNFKCEDTCCNNCIPNNCSTNEEMVYRAAKIVAKEKRPAGPTKFVIESDFIYTPRFNEINENGADNIKKIQTHRNQQGIYDFDKDFDEISYDDNDEDGSSIGEELISSSALGDKNNGFFKNITHYGSFWLNRIKALLQNNTSVDSRFLLPTNETFTYEESDSSNDEYITTTDYSLEITEKIDSIVTGLGSENINITDTSETQNEAMAEAIGHRNNSVYFNENGEIGQSKSNPSLIPSSNSTEIKV
ncbi:hypothetical protein ENBRE01_2321 [Enteropsectra breve]|nr:hypothetical protein ENBRE01_2321 [Enteropsectra breve]